MNPKRVGRGSTPVTAELESAFLTYFEEIERCKKAQCYWSLLHLLVALPDVCSALETENGTADGSGGLYRKWCKNYLDRDKPDKSFTPSDRYALRNVLLHQGRTTTDQGQYRSYSFVQPTPAGEIVHKLIDDFGPDGKNLTLDVSKIADETVVAMGVWFTTLQKVEMQVALENVRRNIRWLARQGQKHVPIPGSIITVSFPTTSSTGGFEKPAR